MSEFIHGDCMEYLKDYPDNYFDLCIADPPYGNARGGQADRFGERFDRYKNTSGGWHGKQKYHKGTLSAQEQQKTGRDMELSELAEHGRGNMQKNHCVGHCPG